MQVVRTSPATMPKGPFSQAVKHNGVTYVAGQVAFDGANGKPLLGDIKEQTRQTLKESQSGAGGGRQFAGESD